MTTAYTSLLGLALPVTGELSGTWGDVVNNSITSLLDSAVAGTTNVSTDGDVTLTTTTGAANTAREAILLFSGARTALRTVTAPAQSKVYTVINATTGGYSVKLVGAGPTTGVTIVAGESAVCAWNGSDFVKVSNAGGSSSFVDLTVSGNLTLSGGTANGVLYLNGSKVATSGSALVFDGSNVGVGRSATAISNYPSVTIGGGQGGILDVGSSSTLYGRFSGDIDGLNVESLVSGKPIIFRANSAEQMRLTSTGLGIGTSSVTSGYKLDVNGKSYLRGTVAIAPSNVVGGFLDSSAAGTLQIGSYNGTGANAGTIIFTRNATLGDVETARFDSSGNLGLGVTPSAWNAGKAFEIGTSVGNAVWGLGANAMSLLSNTYYNSGYKYANNGTATRYDNGGGSGTHAWYTAPSGTAGNAITFTQAMTLDASGNFGLGTTTLTYKLNLKASTGTWLNFTDGIYQSWQLGNDANGIFYNNPNSGYQAWQIGGSEKARIDSSGNLLVGTTGLDGRFRVEAASGASWARVTNHTNSGTQYFDSFRYNGTEIGKITGNNSNVSYVTSSDYRLKENIAPMTDALATVAQLKPCTYTWKIDGAAGQGFIAHELQAVVPDAVVGEKDAVNEDGSIKPQGIDTSFLVATLTAAIQELNAKFEAYKASHP